MKKTKKRNNHNNNNNNNNHNNNNNPQQQPTTATATATATAKFQGTVNSISQIHTRTHEYPTVWYDDEKEINFPLLHIQHSIFKNQPTILNS